MAREDLVVLKVMELTFKLVDLAEKLRFHPDYGFMSSALVMHGSAMVENYLEHNAQESFPDSQLSLLKVAEKEARSIHLLLLCLEENGLLYSSSRQEICQSLETLFTGTSFASGRLKRFEAMEIFA